MVVMDAQTPTSRTAGWFRRVCAAASLLAATMIAVGLGAEIVHRLRLFWFSYSGEPGMNHVADGCFSTVYLASLAAMAMGLAAAWMLRRRLWRWTAGSVGVLSGVLCVTFLVMHESATLVTYSEFVKIYGP
jgi:hypothetical protein